MSRFRSRLSRAEAALPRSPLAALAEAWGEVRALPSDELRARYDALPSAPNLGPPLDTLTTSQLVTRYRDLGARP